MEPIKDFPSLPADELKDWVEKRYFLDDRYVQELKKVHLDAIDGEDVLALENLSNILFVTKEDLFFKDREEFYRQTDLYKRLRDWIRPRLSAAIERRKK